MPVQPSEVTIVTQCSLDRLGRLEAMCESWGGLISCAVHVPEGETELTNGQAEGSERSEGSEGEVMARLMRLHARVEAAGKCRLYLTMLTEDLKDTDCPTAVKDMYPINALRNGE